MKPNWSNKFPNCIKSKGYQCDNPHFKPVIIKKYDISIEIETFSITQEDIDDVVMYQIARITSCPAPQHANEIIHKTPALKKF